MAVAQPTTYQELLASLAASDHHQITGRAPIVERASADVVPSSVLMPETLPTYAESECTRGTKRKAADIAATQGPAPTNPYFDAQLELGAAARHMYKILKDAHASSNWFGTMVEPQFLVVVNKAKKNPGHTICRLIQDISYILELLRCGRQGWKLTNLPYNFHEDIQQLLPDTIMRVNKLSEYRGCQWLVEKLVEPLVEIEKRLRVICKQRAKLEGVARERRSRQQEERGAEMLKKAMTASPSKLIQDVAGKGAIKEVEMEEL